MKYNYKTGFCECPSTHRVSGNSCVLLSEYNSDFGKGYIQNILASQITYQDFVNKTDESKPVVENSDVFNQLFAKAALGCKFQSDPQQCQVLANLCVLQLYNEQTLACKLYRMILMDREDAPQQVKSNSTYYADLGWTPGLPWLYYDQTPKQVLSEGEPLDLTVSFYVDPNDKSRTQQLKYWLATYNVEGEFLGWQELSNQLMPCPRS